MSGASDPIAEAERQIHLLSVEMVNALGLSQDSPMEGEALHAHCELWSSKVVEASRRVDEIIGRLPSEDAAEQRRREREDALVRPDERPAGRGGGRRGTGR